MSPHLTQRQKDLLLLLLHFGLFPTGKLVFLCTTMFNCWNRYFCTKFEQTTKPFLLLLLLGTSSLLKAFAQRDVDSDVQEINNSDTESEEEGADDGQSEQKEAETGTSRFPSLPFHLSQ